MSLIQEALKRQQEEQGEKPGARPPPIPASAAQPPPIPTSMPTTPASEPVPAAPNPLVPDRPMPALDAAPKRGKLWVALGGIGLFAVVLVVGIAYLLSLLGNKPATETTAEPTPTADAPTADAPPPTPAPPVVTTEAPPPPVLAAEPSAPAEPAVAPVGPVAPPATAASAGPAPETAAPVAPTPAVPTATVTAPPAPPPPPPVIWPTLKLTTIMAGAKPGQGAARINGKMVFVGNQVEGVTLMEVKADGVLLRNGGETRFLRVGGTVL